MLALLFILFAGMAVGCAISMVVQRNPLYSAISLIGVFISLACLYMTLAAPFIAAVQVIVYAGAIMVLVVFVIMLLNVEEQERPTRLRTLVPIAVALAAVFFAETAFIIFFVQTSPATPAGGASDVGLTSSIGTGLFTTYLLPFEITSILLLMAVVGAMTLARRGGLIGANIGVVPGYQSFAREVLNPMATPDLTQVEARTSREAEELLGVSDAPHGHDEE
jgi:NADH-quinone oxidoreductase subunit J